MSAATSRDRERRTKRIRVVSAAGNGAGKAAVSYALGRASKSPAMARLSVERRVLKCGSASLATSVMPFAPPFQEFVDLRPEPGRNLRPHRPENPERNREQDQGNDDFGMLENGDDGSKKDNDRGEREECTGKDRKKKSEGCGPPGTPGLWGREIPAPALGTRLSRTGIPVPARAQFRVVGAPAEITEEGLAWRYSVAVETVLHMVFKGAPAARRPSVSARWFPKTFPA